MHRDSYAFCDGYIPTIHTRPSVGVTGYRHDDWTRMYPIGYHATYRSNFSNICLQVRCPGDRCRFQMFDGYLHCPRCHQKMFNPSDISHLAELADLQAEALQPGSTQGLHYLAPEASINAKPHEHQRQGQDVKKSIAATLKEKCIKRWSQRLTNRDSDRLQQSITFEPFTAFNIMSKGMTITSLEEVEMFSRIRIPAPRKGDGGKK